LSLPGPALIQIVVPLIITTALAVVVFYSQRPPRQKRAYVSYHPQDDNARQFFEATRKEALRRGWITSVDTIEVACAKIGYNVVRNHLLNTEGMEIEQLSPERALRARCLVTGYSFALASIYDLQPRITIAKLLKYLGHRTEDPKNARAVRKAYFEAYIAMLEVLGDEHNEIGQFVITSSAMLCLPLVKEHTQEAHAMLHSGLTRLLA
jgi:hypothetical protein